MRRTLLLVGLCLLGVVTWRSASGAMPLAPPTGNTDIEPSHSVSVLPRSQVPFSHLVTHLGVSFDYKDIAANSAQGWALSLFEADGVTPLSDHNHNGLPDTGRLDRGETATIIVQAQVPNDAMPETADVVTVTASSGRNPIPENQDSATDTITVIPHIGPTPTFTPTPSPTPEPLEGTTDIKPNLSASAAPGIQVAYSHTVAHAGVSFDYKDIVALSSQGWALSLFEADGVTPLSDHNGNGLPDTGRLDSGETATIVIKLAVPADAAAGTVDVTTVMANSGRNPTPANQDAVTDTTTV